MSRNHQSDDNLESNDLFEDDQCCSSDDCSGDDGSSRDDDLGAIRLESSGQGRGRGRGRGRSRDDDDSDKDSDKVTGIKGKGYTFDLDAEGIVTNLMRVKKGVAKPESIDSNESWTFNPTAGTLIKTEIYPNGSEVKTYIDDPRTTEVLYIFASEQFL